MANFPTNRSLLNPKFEGYKLSPLAQEDHIARFPLTARPSQANVSGRSRIPLSFEEVQSRITHNHLFMSWDARSAVYIDDDLNVIRVILNPDLTPIFSTFSELPKPIETDDPKDDRHKEYPSAVSMESWWLVSDGTGLLYVFSETRAVAVFHLSTDDNPSTYIPFRVHAARLTSPDTAVCVLSCRRTRSSEIEENQKEMEKIIGVAHFDVLLVRVTLNTTSEENQTLEVIWKARGVDVPLHVGFDTSRDAFFVLGKLVYRGVGIATPPAYEPAMDELAPIPRAGEVSDGSSKPPPYSWTQTPDSVTVAFPLPSNIPKSAIHVTLTAKSLSLLVKHELPTSFQLPRYSLKQLWDGINPSSSYWTWDREADRDLGLLTLHLDKQHDGTRWAHVFATAGTLPSSERTDPTDEEVPETLDPSELYTIREALEKYTSALQKGEDASGLGLGSGMPKLAENELDEAVDSAIGRQFAITWVRKDGTIPAWSAKEDAGTTSVLSVPVPGLQESEPSLVVKSDIDGLLFVLPPISSDESSMIPSQNTWKHIATYPALAFVLASKRDTRFTFHMSSFAVFAFESGTEIGGGNVYIYRGLQTGSKASWAKQAVLRVSGGVSGALLGAGALRRDDNSVVLLCLCEKELVVVKNAT